MELVKLRMEKCRFLNNSMDLCSFGLERLDAWFGTFSCDAPKLEGPLTTRQPAE